MENKFIRERPNPYGLWYLREYEYECVKCGAHYIMHQHSKRISPYCGKCHREITDARVKARAEQRKKEMIEEAIREHMKYIEQFEKQAGEHT